jgi:hypothetical protein
MRWSLGCGQADTIQWARRQHCQGVEQAQWDIDMLTVGELARPQGKAALVSRGHDSGASTHLLCSQHPLRRVHSCRLQLHRQRTRRMHAQSKARSASLNDGQKARRSSCGAAPVRLHGRHGSRLSLTLKALGGPEPLPSVPELCSHPVNVQISKWWKVLSIVLCHACCAAVGTAIPPRAGLAAEAASSVSSSASIAAAAALRSQYM